MQRLGVKQFTNSVLAELNRVYEDEASTSFTDSLVRTKSSGLEKKSKKDKRKERVRVQKELTKVVNEHFAESPCQASRGAYSQNQYLGIQRNGREV